MSTPDGGPSWTALPSLHRNAVVMRLLGTAWLGPGIVFAITLAAYVLIPAAWAFAMATSWSTTASMRS